MMRNLTAVLGVILLLGLLAGGVYFGVVMSSGTPDTTDNEAGDAGDTPRAADNGAGAGEPDAGDRSGDGEGEPDETDPISAEDRDPGVVRPSTTDGDEPSNGTGESGTGDEVPSESIGNAPAGSGIEVIIIVQNDGGEALVGARVLVSTMTLVETPEGTQLERDEHALATNDRGRVVVTRVGAERATVMVSHPGYASETLSFRPTDGSEGRYLARITLSTGASIVGRLIDAETNAAPDVPETTADRLRRDPENAAQLLAANLAMRSESGSRIGGLGQLRYNVDTGEFTMPFVGLGRYLLRVEMAGYNPTYRRVTVDRRGSADMGTIELQPQQEVTLTVIEGGTARPIEGAEVEATTITRLDTAGGFVDVRKRVGQLEPTDAEGRTVFRLPTGVPVELNVTADGYPSAIVTRQIAEGQAELTIELTAPGRLAGVVRDGEGQPVDGAHIAATRAEPTNSRLRVTTGTSGPDGRFELPTLQPGSYTVDVTFAVEGRSVRITYGPLVVRSGETTTIESSLSDEMSLVIRLQDRAGNPLPNAIVATSSTRDGQEVQATTDGEGLATLSFDPNPNYPVIHVTSDDGQTAQFRVRAPDVGRLEHTLRMPPTDPALLGALSVTITPANGAPAEPVVVGLTRADADTLFWSAEEPATSGSVTFANVPPGRYELQTSGAGTLDTRRFVEVAAGEQSVRVAIYQAATITIDTDAAASLAGPDERFTVFATPLDSDRLRTASLSIAPGARGDLSLAVGNRYLLIVRIDDREIWRATRSIEADTTIELPR